MSSFLSPEFLPKWSTLTADQIEPSIRKGLKQAEENITAIANQPAANATFKSSFLALEDATESLSRGWGRLSHLDSVSDNPEQREALNQLLPDVTDFFSSLSLNPHLWNILKTVSETKEIASLSEIEKRFVEETLDDFRSSGADLPDDQKNRIAQIDAELSKITKQYSENVLDSTNAWELVITDESKLAGLPDSAKAAAAANAQSKNLPQGSFRFTLQAPSYFPILQHAHDEELRKTCWQAASKVASEEPHDNSKLVWDILKLRQEKAEILGHQNFAALTLQRRMAQNGINALNFIEALHDRIQPIFLQETKQLAAYKAAKTGAPTDSLEPWETSYYAEMQRKENFDFDDEILRPYFPVSGVMHGMFEIATKIFKINITEKPTIHADSSSDIQVWHPEVAFYEIHDQTSGAHLGSFYADWHPRETKRGGAWMNSLHTGKIGEPHLGLIIGNMSPPVGNTPALLTHSEVETIFHEFGHLLHGLLSSVPIRSLSGTNVAWDFVELPSQLMENFCWERETLDQFARHHETGETIPDELFTKMIAAKNYMAASTFMRQLALGKIDLEIHVHLQKYLGRSLEEIDEEILSDYRAPMKTKAPSMVRRFNHLFSSITGYAAGYYSYKWAEVLDADAFTRFRKEGITNAETGIAFRNEILSKGNSAPPDILFENFMGRPADPDALLKRSGLA